MSNSDRGDGFGVTRSGASHDQPQLYTLRYRDRLLRLPPFLRSSGGGPNGWSDQDLQDGFALTGMFLLRHVLEPRGQGHSDARDGFINAVTKHRARMALP